MQKFTLSICCFSALLIIGLSSCKDDEPYVPANLSVNTETVTILESGGTASIEIILDKAAPSDITVEYDLGGTALSPADYSVSGTEGELDIPQGQTSATIEIDIVNDAVYEGDETIEITIQNVNTEDVVITNDDEAVVTITEDDPQITAAFASTTLALNEDDGIVEVNVTLSQAAPAAVTLQYTLSGTARDSVTARAANPDLPADFAVRGPTPGQLQIAAGQTSGIIRLGIYSDFVVEDADPNTDPWDPETIVISLTQASGGVQISTTNDEMQISVAQQDGKVIALFWDVDNDNTTVDMDLFLWIGNLGANVADLELVSLSVFEGTEGPEVVFIPATITEVKYGLSYTYYAGDVTPMAFESHFIDFASAALGDREIYDGSYTLANINAWDALDDIVHIEQTFEVDADGNFINISTISTPTTGSRVASYKLPAGTKKMKSNQIKTSSKIRPF